MSLATKIRQKKARIGVIGLGYVGLPLAVEYASKGFRTVGIETDKAKVDAVNAGKNYIEDVETKALRRAVKRGLLTAMTDYGYVASLDVLFICVPTPFTANKEPDISYIVSATEQIAPRLRKEHLVILKSTTFPNTTEGHVRPILEKTGLKVGKDFYLAFSPERIDPGNKRWTTANTPIVVGGVTPECTKLACLITQKVVSKAFPVA